MKQVKSSKKVYYEQYQLREEGGVGDAGGKLEAANMPDQGEGDRAARERAARGVRAGPPAGQPSAGRGGGWRLGGVQRARRQKGTG